jgi:arsenate reductase
MTSTVLFLSVRNAGRTQMAAAWFNALAHPGKATAVSAGTTPAPAILPLVVEVMNERGMGISSGSPRLLTPGIEASADLLILFIPPHPEVAVARVGERDEWLVTDPGGEPRERVRAICDDVEKMVRRLLVARHWMPLGASMPPSIV